MDKALIEKFVNIHIRIVLKPDFILDGYIKEMGETGCIFVTTQKSSYIAYEQILQISPVTGEKNGR